MNIFFLLLLSFSLTFASLGDEGPGFDPNGGRLRISGDEGSGSDPHGGRVTTSGDEGSGLDPHGGQVTAQGRGGWDPNG